MPKISILGTGNMAGAILEGMLENGLTGDEPIRVTTRSSDSADELNKHANVRAESLEASEDANLRAVEGAGVVLLGVKPQMISGLLDEVGPHIAPGTILISVAAGVEIPSIEAKVQDGVRVIRAMPNTPAGIGLGATGIAPGKDADDEAMAIARAVFEAVGTVVAVEESLIPAVGAVSGSGPAYVFYFIEQLIDAGVEVGLDRDAATELALQTFTGASELATRRREVGPAELRRRVTSPKGTTEQSIRVFDERDVPEIFGEALRANVRRSDELASEA